MRVIHIHDAAQRSRAGVVAHQLRRARAGFERRAAIPEESAEYWTKHINNPSITAFLPAPDKANGAAVVIVPGGGHWIIVITTVGNDVARWYAASGVAAFVVRYRLFREEGSPYVQEDARADVA